jgi:hypothetical protein
VKLAKTWRFPPTLATEGFLLVFSLNLVSVSVLVSRFFSFSVGTVADTGANAGADAEIGGKFKLIGR